MEIFGMYLTINRLFLGLTFSICSFLYCFSQSNDSITIDIHVDYINKDSTLSKFFVKKKKFDEIEFFVNNDKYIIVAFYIQSYPDLGKGDIIPAIPISGNKIDCNFSDIFKEREYGNLRTSEGLLFNKFYLLDKRSTDVIVVYSNIIIEWENRKNSRQAF